MKDKIEETAEFPKMAMTSNQTDYFLPVYPGEKVKVISRKEYFRFGKLKCQVEMRNEKEELACKGIISGMMITNSQ